MELSLGFTRALLVSSLVCVSIASAGTAHAQFDSDLVHMAVKGGFTFGGLKASRYYHKSETNFYSNKGIDSARTDTIDFSIIASWRGTPPFHVTPTYAYPSLQYFEPLNGVFGEIGFSFDLDTNKGLLLSLSCIFDNDNRSSVTTLMDDHEISIDSIPYTMSGGVLTASLSGRSLFDHLTKFYISYYSGYAGGGVNGSISETYSLFGDSSKAYFSFDIDGATNAVLNRAHKQQAVCVYPNPCSNEMHVNLPTAKNSPIRIYNVLGGLCETIHPASRSNTVSIDTHSLPNGRYMLATGSSSVAFSVLR
jgi:hypothetical protein